MSLVADTKEVIVRRKTRYVAFLATEKGYVMKETKPQASREEAITKLKLSEPKDLAILDDEEEEEL